MRQILPVDNVIEQISEAANGLTYTSEIDAPFQIVIWGSELKIDNIVSPVEILTLETIFETAIVEKDWHDAEDKLNVQRFKNLVSVLKQYLTSIQVYCIGEVQKDIYIVGKAFSFYVGLSTKSVET